MRGPSGIQEPRAPHQAPEGSLEKRPSSNERCAVLIKPAIEYGRAAFQGNCVEEQPQFRVLGGCPNNAQPSELNPWPHIGTQRSVGGSGRGTRCRKRVTDVGWPMTISPLIHWHMSFSWSSSHLVRVQRVVPSFTNKARSCKMRSCGDVGCNRFAAHGWHDAIAVSKQ